MPLLPLIMQLHPDTIAFMSRVTGSATVPPAAVTAIDEFVKYCYKNNLRDTTGANHIIQSCYIAASTVLTKLWFRSGESSSLAIVGSPTYSVSNGVAVQGGTNEVRTHSADLVSPNNCSLFIHNFTNTGNRDFIGSDNTPNRLLIHPAWIDDNRIYFDCGNATTARVHNVATGGNSAGLIIGTKLNSTQSLYLRGDLIAQITNSPTTGLTFPNTAIAAMGRGGTDVVSSRNIGGFGTGRAIPPSLISGFTTAWNAVQTALGR